MQIGRDPSQAARRFLVPATKQRVHHSDTAEICSAPEFLCSVRKVSGKRRMWVELFPPSLSNASRSTVFKFGETIEIQRNGIFAVVKHLKVIYFRCNFWQFLNSINFTNSWWMKLFNLYNIIQLQNMQYPLFSCYYGRSFEYFPSSFCVAARDEVYFLFLSSWKFEQQFHKVFLPLIGGTECILKGL